MPDDTLAELLLPARENLLNQTDELRLGRDESFFRFCEQVFGVEDAIVLN